MRAIVVGGTSGIGEGIAHRLAKAQVSVTIVGRNAQRGAEIIQDLNKLSGKDSTNTSSSTVQHEFIACDSLLFENIRQFIETINQRYNSLDYLVLSQGIATTQSRTETKEGMDEKLMLHYFGRMYFIKKLLPLLRRAESGGRVLSVFSAGVHQHYAEYNTDFELKKNYGLQNAANAAGIYNDLCLDAFSQQPENNTIAFIHSAPGFVNTNWGRELPCYYRVAVNIIKPIVGMSIDDSGEIMSNSLLSDDFKPSFYLVDRNGNPAKKNQNHSPEAREFVWTQTNQLFESITRENSS